MTLSLHRTKHSPTSVLGFLEFGATYPLYTLERPDKSSGGLGPFCIPEGTYSFTVEWMEHLQLDAPLLQNVPGRTGIFIHPGNYPKDSEGCILVGTSQSKDFVGQSRDAFGKLMEKLEKGTVYQIEVR